MQPELRPYQIEALNALGEAIKTKDRLLLIAATGAGKTAMICRFIQKFYFEYPDRNFLVVSHKQLIIEQFIAAFKKFTEIKSSDIGVCCSGMGRRELKSRIVLATIQTIVNCLGDYAGASLVVVDETHRVSVGLDSQYNQLLNTLEEYVPGHKTIGVTGTGFRLGHGEIFGSRCKADRVNFFPEVTHRVLYSTLRDSGYLMPLKGYIADGNAAKDLSSVPLVAGEYNMSDAGKVMSKYVNAAVDALELYGAEHKHVCIFCCVIKHVEEIVEAFRSRGHSIVPIHSKLSKTERENNLRSWQSGEVRIAASVNVLTEAFDYPALSCIVFCRPSKSSTVWLQAIGRILRMHPDKKESLLIDLTGNAMYFGLDLDSPKVIIPYGSGNSEAPTKICPFVYPDGRICGERVHTATRFCPSCEFEWTVEEVEAVLPELKKVSFGAPVEAPLWHKVSYMSISIHQNQETGKRLLRLQFECPGENVYAKNIFVSDWLCFKCHYSGFAVEKGKEKWNMFSYRDYPEDVDTAEWYAKESFATPKQVLLKKDGKWHRILDYKFEEEEESLHMDTAFANPFDKDQLYTGEDLPF